MGAGSVRGTAAAIIFFVAAAIAAYSCAVNPVTGRSELAIVSISEEEEIRLGAQAYGPAVQQQGGFFRDRALEEYVQRVGMRIARVSHRPNLAYRFRVLNSSIPNAFALPGGYIVINRGLLAGLTNEAQLAAVLGHETGHVTARHSVAGYQRAIAADILLAGIAIGTGGRRSVMQLSSISASLVQNGFSREQEREADSLGIDYMVRAGYNPEGAIQLQEYFYRELEGSKNPLFFEGLFRTHPFSRERLDNARAEIARKYPGTAGNPNYTFNASDFRRATGRLKEVQKAYEVADAGDRLLKEKRYAEAAAKYDEAIAMEPDQAPFHSSKGRALLLLGRDAAAEPELRRAIRLDDDYFEPHLLLGVLLHRAGDHRSAIAELLRSMDLLPTKTAAGYLSKSYEAIGDRENALRYAEMAR